MLKLEEETRLVLPRGRPKDGAKRNAILDASQEIFPIKGFSKTAMSDIAKAANVSKLTLYSHFIDKQDLFITALQERCFKQMPWENFQTEYQGLNASDALFKLGRALLDAYLSENALSMYRLMLCECKEHPKLAQTYFEIGMGGMIKRFVVVLQSVAEQGEYHFPHLRRAAMHFYALAKGHIHPRMLFGYEPAPTRAEQDGHLREAVALFLKAHKI